MKKVTFRVSVKDHEKLRIFASKQGLSVNTLLKKAIQLNFNFKTHDVIKISPFMTSATPESRKLSPAELAMLHASMEALVLLRELAKKEGGDLLKHAKDLAKQKVSELTE